MIRLDDIISVPCRYPGERVSTGAIRDWCMQPILCADGTRISVQASRTHYCTPRDNRGPWTDVEVGFPSVKPPDSWAEYAEDWSNPTETVYGYIPVGMVREFIAAHGGEAEAPVKAKP